MTRGSGRGRGRGQNINAKRETAMNNLVNFANTLENMAAAMQAMAETIGQQVNNGDRSNGENRLMTLAIFLKINLPTFRGTTNPTEADNWFQATEWALQVQQVPEDQCVEFATYQLMGEALYWWQETRHLLQQDNVAIPWDVFQSEFYKKYFPNSVRTAKELELLQLKQGPMSVAEYTSRFEKLCGMRSDILSIVGPMEIRVFSELVNKSRVNKDCARKAALDKGDHRAFVRRDLGRNFAPRGQNFKRGNYVPLQLGQNNFRRFNNNNNQGRGKGKQIRILPIT
ncbi:uncharacterized protein LOC130945438 [Arachis stenosperma]|uniref:uncharacterized protein LOC130945438 n=1 Tax=Arachis stenosperma TaxID=217475 RepID=UPI0025ACF8DF|nr:uncharacterized protein LOC130945438 [Arachis stenosperma]